MATANGIILWEGPSPIDGSPLVCVATGIAKASANAKTGAMVQTWIMRTDIPPHVAVASGADVSACGLCPLRPHVAGAGTRCYVRTSDAPLAVWKSYVGGKYPRAADAHSDPTAGATLALLMQRQVRAGSYGDPAMVPPAVWAGLPVATGYTHQWRAPWAQAHRAWCMASVDGDGDRREAEAMGWRCFQVVREGQDVDTSGMLQCLSETHGKQCADCGLCGGLRTPGAKSIWIAAHGATQKCVGPAIPQATARGRLTVLA